MWTLCCTPLPTWNISMYQLELACLTYRITRGPSLRYVKGASIYLHVSFVAKVRMHWGYGRFRARCSAVIRERALCISALSYPSTNCEDSCRKIPEEATQPAL